MSLAFMALSLPVALRDFNHTESKFSTPAYDSHGLATLASTARDAKGGLVESVVDRRTQRRLRQQDLSRTHLLDAAEEIFGSRGFALATLKEIAELAGFAVGSVYLFFPSKEDLFRQVWVRRGAEFMPGMTAALDPADGADPLLRLHRLVDFQVGFFRDHPAFARLYLRFSGTADAAHGVTVDPSVQLRFEEAMRMQAELFTEGQHTGVFREGDPAVLSRMFSGLVHGYQSLDPAVMSADPQAAERLPIATLHEIVEAAFCGNAS
jgi:AcrR family transcriptional regulator